MVLPLLLALAPSAAPAPLPVRPAPQGRTASEESAPTDEALRKRFRKLPRRLRDELPEALRLEVSWLDSFQVALLRHLTDAQTRAPESWPELEDPTWFDPQEHAPGQPIRRKRLNPRSSKAKKAVERFLGAWPEPRLESAFVYDWGARELRRVPAKDESRRVFENAMAGFPPELDLALALLEMQLDDGAQAAALGAFAHAYTDRAGNAYPGLTLYDAWSSGREMEMPDVDILGVLHTVVGEWERYRAPVPDRQHDALYDQIGALFQAAHRHRGLRQALARTYLLGDPQLRDGYGASLIELHALWESAASTPAELTGRLPDAAGWRRFLDEWSQEVGRSPALRTSGENRRATLIADGAAVRRALVRVVEQFEAAVERDRANPDQDRADQDRTEEVGR